MAHGDYSVAVNRAAPRSPEAAAAGATEQRRPARATGR
jgi:hypothetical protein